jgi:hypothetical protein
MTYAQDRIDAAASLAEDGMTVTVTYRTPGAYDPATGTTSISTSTATAKGVIFPFSVGLRKMAGTNIVEGDQQLILAALATDGSALTAPKVDDTVSANGKSYSIVDVAPLAPGGTDLIYTCTIRGAA